MLFIIAVSLNSPFGYDIQDIRLSKITAKYALTSLMYYIDTDDSLNTLINARHDQPDWWNKLLDVNMLTSRSQSPLHADLSRF